MSYPQEPSAPPPSAPPPSYSDATASAPAYGMPPPYPPPQQQAATKTEDGKTYSALHQEEPPTVVVNHFAQPYGQGYVPPPVQYGAPPPPPINPRVVTPGYPSPNSVSPDSTDGNEEALVGNTWAGGSFSDKAIRRAFIRKVYLILMTQLLVTTAVVLFFTFHVPTQMWVKKYYWFYYISYGTFLVTYIALVCCPSVRRKSPGNFICLAIFTLAFTYMTATISSYYSTWIVLICLGITTAVCLSITLFAVQTKYDFTMCTGLLFAGSMALFFFGIITIIVYATIGYSYILNCVYGGLAGLLFSMFLAYDTQMLVGGRKHELSPEEYIFGALQLYLDVVYLFLIILSLFGGNKN